VEEISAVESISEFSIEEQAAEPAEIAIEEAPAAFAEEPVAVEEVAIEPPAAVVLNDVPHDVPQHVPEEAPVAQHLEPVAAEPPVVEHPAPAPGVLQEFVTDLESSLGESFLPGTIAQELAPEPATAHVSAQEPVSQPELEPIGNAAPTTFGVPQPEVVGEFVADLEASLGDDFLKGAPVPEPATAQPEPVVEAAPAVAAAVHTPAPVVVPQAPVAIPVAASAAAAASGASTISAQTSSPAPQQSAAALASTPQIPPIVPGAPAAGKSSPFGEDAGIDLAEMFGELKQDLESGSSTTEEDPETHYNLGIAFREMGLLDEAIGELQKTCQAVDRGHPFPQVMQTYTWLAQCFLDKGVPEAAIRWYQKALAVATIDEDTRTALHYELAAAYEASGDRPSALKHFMEVYGRNIDYRDVAERIKPLKS
jgi:hypothetical protein